MGQIDKELLQNQITELDKEIPESITQAQLHEDRGDQGNADLYRRLASLQGNVRVNAIELVNREGQDQSS